MCLYMTSRRLSRKGVVGLQSSPLEKGDSRYGCGQAEGADRALRGLVVVNLSPLMNTLFFSF
jgi:hypothetical protein